MYSRVPPLHDDATKAVEADGHQIAATENKKICEDKKPKHVSKDIWERFQSLQKRTDDITRRSTEKRLKHLQKKIIEDVQEQITLPEDKDILHHYDVKFGPPVKEKEVTPKRKRKLDNNECDGNTGPSESPKLPDDSNKDWSEIKQYLDVNKHLKGTDPGKYAPNTKLDDAIDNAISKGEFEKAEDLSDRLATREFGKKIADAIDARDYTIAKKEEEESAKAKKKKKLPWGFVHKQRWETKSNM